MKATTHRKKCAARPERYLGMVIDGMDQQKTNLPHWPRAPSGLKPECQIQVHVVGCLIFSKPTKLHVFLNYPNLHNDSNLIITIIQTVINEFEGSLPPVLYLQLDNTARENKNNLLMTYLNYLVAKRVFKKIKVGFLLVGHTHDNIDQMFSHFLQRLNRQSATIIEKLIFVIASSYTPWPKVTIIPRTFDFRRFAFSPPKITIAKLQNISFQHQFKIQLPNLEHLVPNQWGKRLSTDPD